MSKKKNPRQDDLNNAESPVPTAGHAAPATELDGLAIRLREARERMELSLADLLKKTGLSRSALHGYETGKARPGAREIRLLCDSLMISPNRLLYGTEEPFAVREGLRALVKLKGNTPVMLAVSSFALPILVASLDEEQLEALLVLIATMLEAKNPEAYSRVSAFAEVFSELIGTGSPEEMKALSAIAKDPQRIAEIQAVIQERLSRSS